MMDSINQEKEAALVLELEQKYRNRILNQSYENLKQHNDQQRIITGLVLLSRCRCWSPVCSTCANGVRMRP